MPASIMKRDGASVPFDSVKILNAITKANQAVGGEDMSPTDLLFVTEKVCRKLDERSLRHVEEIQDVVEETLIQYDYAKTAKAYILYRAEHAKIRNAESYLMDIYKKLTYSPAIREDIKRENANIDGDTAMGTMLKYGSEGSKFFIDNYILPKDASAAHLNGDIHIHDKDFYMLTETCCQINLIPLFKNGFSTGHGYLREPNSIESYSALACIAIQANQNEMHGGQSVPNFDYAMAQGVDKTYTKEYFKALVQFFQVSKAMPYDQVRAMIDNVKENLGERVNMDQAQEFARKFVDYLPRHQRENGFEEITEEEARGAAQYAAQTAWRETDKATYQDEQYQNQLDAETIYFLLEHNILPLYYERKEKDYPETWVKYIKNSVAQIAPRFTMKRQLDDYYDGFYNKLSEHFHVLAADNYAKAKTLAGWKAAVDSRWNAVEIVSVNAGKGLDATVEAGKEYEMTVVIDEKGLDNAIGLESVIIRHEENEDRIHEVIPFSLTSKTVSFSKGKRNGFGPRRAVPSPMGIGHGEAKGRFPFSSSCTSGNLNSHDNNRPGEVQNARGAHVGRAHILSKGTDRSLRFSPPVLARGLYPRAVLAFEYPL